MCCHSAGIGPTSRYGSGRGTKLSGMKKVIYRTNSLIIMALGVAIFSGCGTTGSSSNATATTNVNANSGSLVINRAANMGSGLYLHGSIDGKRVANLSSGQRYSGSLSAGPHLVSVILEPNDLNLAPTQKRSRFSRGRPTHSSRRGRERRWFCSDRACREAVATQYRRLVADVIPTGREPSRETEQANQKRKGLQKGRRTEVKEDGDDRVQKRIT